MGPRLGNGISPCFFAFLRGGIWQAIPKSFLFFGETGITFLAVATCIILQEGDVMGHSTSKEKLLQVIQESGVVSWSKERWQLLDGNSESPHAACMFLAVLVYVLYGVAD